MDYPLVSVVLAVYNEEKYINEAIQSILNQSYTNFELIIINDGSTDKSGSVISSFDDYRIKNLYQRNSGQATARNVGLKLTKGKYIAIHDADDVSEENRLEEQVSFLEKNPEVIAVGSYANVIDKDGYYLYTAKNPEIINENHNWTGSPFIHSSVMFRKKIVLEGIKYPDLPVAEDTGFFYRLNKLGKLKNITMPLVKYRIQPNAISRRNRKLKKLIAEILEEYFDTGILNEEKIKQYKKAKSKQSNQDQMYHYHILLSKKYLWNNYSANESKFHLRKAMVNTKQISFYFEPFLLYVISFLGEKNVSKLYKFLKK